jgi:hypothetical protein
MLLVSFREEPFMRFKYLIWRLSPFHAKLMELVGLISSSYSVRLIIAKVTRPFGSWILKMPLFSPVQLLFQFHLTMTGGKDARTLENPGKCQAANSPFCYGDLWIQEGFTWSLFR